MERAHDSQGPPPGDKADSGQGFGGGLIAVILIGLALVLLFRATRPAAVEPAIPLPPMNVAGWLNTERPISDETLRGQVVLVDCWATWCGPCVEAMPDLVRFHRRYRDSGLVLIGLTTEAGDQLADVERYVESVEGLTWPIGYGAAMPYEMMGISAIPTLILFDKSGRSVWSGHHLDGLEDAVERALAQ